MLAGAMFVLLGLAVIAACVTLTVFTFGAGAAIGVPAMVVGLSAVSGMTSGLMVGAAVGVSISAVGSGSFFTKGIKTLKLAESLEKVKEHADTEVAARRAAPAA